MDDDDDSMTVPSGEGYTSVDISFEDFQQAITDFYSEQQQIRDGRPKPLVSPEHLEAWNRAKMVC